MHLFVCIFVCGSRITAFSFLPRSTRQCSRTCWQLWPPSTCLDLCREALTHGTSSSHLSTSNMCLLQVCSCLCIFVFFFVCNCNLIVRIDEVFVKFNMGMCYNPLLKSWSWSNDESINYALYAQKLQTSVHQ